jgi:hypothetical protein
VLLFYLLNVFKNFFDNSEPGLDSRERRCHLSLRARGPGREFAIRFILAEAHSRLQHGGHVFHEEDENSCGTGKEKSRKEYFLQVFGHGDL